MSEPSLIKFVAKLQALGVQLNLLDGELKVKAPKDVLQGELLAEVKEKKQAIQDYLQLLSHSQKKAKTKIPLADRSLMLPLSYGQQRLWFLDQLSEGSAFYNMPMVLKIEGELNIERFELTVKKLIDRHEILRTNFKQDEHGLHQVIHKEVNWSVNIIDFPMDNLPNIEQEKALKEKINALCLQAFNLADDLLFRIHIIRTSQQCCYFINVMHHIIGDAWSTEILVRELLTCYLFGEQALPYLTIQYADYAAWQRDWLSGAVLDTQLAFWERELADVPALQLPFDRIRPALETHQGARVKITLDTNTYKQLKTFSEQQGLTLFMTLMAAYQVLLSRYSGQEDFAIGTPIANRDKEELSNQLGFFINTLAIRSCVENNLSFIEVAARVKQRLLNAYSHQELPFEQIVDFLKIERSTSHAPIFQSMLVLNSSSFANQTKSGLDTRALGESDLANLKISMLESEHVNAKFDLNCELVEFEQSLVGHIEYNTDLFEHETIEQLAKHFLVLINTLLSSPQKNISQLSFLENELSEQIIEHSQGQTIVYPQYTNVSEYLSAVLVEHKDALALRCEGESISYGELHKRSEQLARYLQGKSLQEKGLQAKEQAQALTTQPVVALCLDRSVDMVVSIVAAIKAGYAYLPLDPELPQERLDFMLLDSQAQCVLTQSSYAQRFSSIPVIDLHNAEVQAAISACQHSLVNSAKPEDLFNIIYTSGSTGNPKGVMVTQAGILNRIQWMQSEYTLKPSDKVLQKTTYSFDVSVWEFIWPLSQGACLVLAKPEGHKDPEYLSALIHSEQISHCHFVPSMLVSWLEQDNFVTTPSLQKVFCSGEALSREAVNRFYAALPNCELHNLYGPTEAAIDVSYWHCEQGLDSACMVPIGKPVSNTQLWVLDEQGQLLAPGVAGELHIGGVQLARGYLNRDDLNQQLFIEQDIAGLGKQRLYKTGDLVRQRRDGVIDYLGRIDHQVKIRGYRIELGEIESRLQSIDGITLSVVVAASLSVHSENVLVAYVSTQTTLSTKAEKDNLVHAIKAELGKHLPSYMVPSVVMVLDEMPLLNNGKINRKRLPKVEIEQAEFIEPSSDTEKALAAIWQEVLGIKRIGVLDNFFELGGHSLLATRVLSKIRMHFKQAIRLVNLFEYPELKNLAYFIDQQEFTTSLVNIEKIDRNLVLPLSYSQQRIWFLEQLSPGSLFYHIPAVLKLSGHFDVVRFEQGIQTIIKRHESLRTVFQTSDNDDEPRQIIQNPQAWQLEKIVLKPADENIIKFKVAELLVKPFDLTTGPLFRVHLLEVDEHQYYLVAVMHHIISDAWSIEVLLKEIVSAYVMGESSLPELAIQYADYAYWQRKILTEVLDEQQKYWYQQLANVPALQLPFDRIRPPLESHRGSALAFELDATLTNKLKNFSKQKGVTLFMSLMAVYQLLLYRYSGQRDFAVGTPIANRNHPQLENLIGCFINTLAIRATIKQHISFSDMLAQVKRNSLAAFSNQELPFEKIVDALAREQGLDRNLSHAPVFQVMLVFNNKALGSAFDKPTFSSNAQNDLQISLVKMDHVTAKFDLNLEMSEANEKVVGHLEYNTDLFDQATAQQFLTHFKTLLECLLDKPNAPIESFQFLENELSEQIIEHSQGQTIDYPQYANVSEYLSAVLVEHKDALALRCEGESISYGELHERSEQLARYLQTKRLQEKGLQAKRLQAKEQAQELTTQPVVALCLDRSVDMVVSILASIKAGYAYLPLDPELPQERLDFMLLDSQAQCVLTQSSYAQRFSSIPVIDLHNAEVRASINACEHPLVNSAKAEDLFNIIYTSGSTGNPKGVMVTQAGILNRIQWMQSEYTLKPSDKVLQKTTYSFDVSVWEFIWPLSQGACLVLAKPEGHKDPEYLSALIHSEQISHCHFVPSMLVSWLEQDNFVTAPSLQKVFCSGEALSREAVNRFYAALPNCELHNLYGPTEAAIDVSYWHCEQGLDSACMVPIGKPVSNTQLWVLDEQGQLLAPGVAGELHIGGVQLARGYLNRDDLNQQLFIEQDIAGLGKQRLYKTGDLVRQRRDGVIDYLGRIDHQVKIRGYRIELGEIESRLQSIDGIALSVVVAASLSAQSENVLVAYVSTQTTLSTKADKDNLVHTIKAELGKHLPSYMIPSVVMVLDEMPLLNNGKINRKRLPKVEIEQAEFIEPSSDTEKALAAIWQEVLGIKRIGVLDNFFELGGHSLLATKVISRVNKHFSLQIPLVELFHYSVLQQLANFIDTLIWTKSDFTNMNNANPDHQEREEFEL